VHITRCPPQKGKETAKEMTPQTKAKSLDALVKSQGWRVIREVMEREVVDAAMAIAEQPTMSLDEINFRRGSIWAAKSLLDLPEKLQMQLTAELALTRDDKSKPDNL
jgi:hypothetical protein